MDKLFNLYKRVLLAHIMTKTTNSQFHEKSEEFYDLLFKCFHLISEKEQDIWLADAWDCEEHIDDTYNTLEEAKVIIEARIKQKNSVWMDNLLRGLADELEWACGNAKAFIKEEEYEEEEEEETTPKKEPATVRDYVNSIKK